jgi:hypothetical protein
VLQWSGHGNEIVFADVGQLAKGSTLCKIYCNMSDLYCNMSDRGSIFAAKLYRGVI